MTNADRFLDYLDAKRALLRAAIMYQENPTEGQLYALKVAARLFASKRRFSKIERPIAEEP